ncbi:MAG: lysostaphin resistance A-like protein [Candidatus Baltobacteraceae bacterium]
MENSSGSPILHDSPIVYAADSFPARRSVLVALGLAGIVLLCVAAVLGAIVIVLISAHLDRTAIAQHAIALTVVLQAVIDAGVVVYLVLALPALAKTTLAGLGFTRPNGTQIAVALGGAVLMILIVNGTGALIAFLLHNKHEQAAIQLFLAEKNPVVKAAFAALAIIVAPIAEEMTFRVFIFNAVRKHGSFWIAAAVSGVCFGLAHMDPYALVPLIFGGAILCGVYAYSKNAYMSMITHALFNAVSVIGLYAVPNLVK